MNPVSAEKTRRTWIWKDVDLHDPSSTSIFSIHLQQLTQCDDILVDHFDGRRGEKRQSEDCGKFIATRCHQSCAPAGIIRRRYKLANGQIQIHPLVTRGTNRQVGLENKGKGRR
jgi:hypothetical protein